MKKSCANCFYSDSGVCFHPTDPFGEISGECICENWKKRLTLYFAHNFYNRKEFRKLELQLEQELDIDLLNPFYDVPERKEEMKALDSGKVKRWCVSDPEYLVTRDLKNLASCDGLLTIVEKPSFGTAIEICNAVLMRKKIFFISEKYIDHPFIKVYVENRFKTLEEFKNFIKQEYKCPLPNICNKGYACDACPYRKDKCK